MDPVASPERAWSVLGIGSHNIGLVIVLCVLIPVLVYKFYSSVSMQQSSSTKRPRHRVICTNALYPYGVEEIQGKRAYMEDRHIVQGELCGSPNTSFYAVFDGHGGSKAADFCVDNLVENLTMHRQFVSEPRNALREAFLLTDKEFMDIAHSYKLDDGTTAIAALVIGDRILVANAGDSRAVLVQCTGKVVPLSIDHKPHRASERARIAERGGSVYFSGVWRVEGILAVSRAIGDRILKHLVTSEPDILERKLTPVDRYMVLASDGVWDVMMNEEVAELIHEIPNPQEAATRIVEVAYQRGSMDNITALVVDMTRPRNGGAAAAGRASATAAGAGPGAGTATAVPSGQQDAGEAEEAQSYRPTSPPGPSGSLSTPSKRFR